MSTCALRIYEAGPTGYGLYRAARGVGVRCEVIAPSKTPRASGEKVKNDRKDTEHLLPQLMAGALTPIAVPTESVEAARDLARAREQVRGDLMRCRHRLSKLLLRHGRMWDASTWTKAHERWLGSQRFEQVNTELAYIDALAAYQGLTARRESLDERLSQVAREAEFLADRQPAARVPRVTHERDQTRRRDVGHVAQEACRPHSVHSRRPLASHQPRSQPQAGQRQPSGQRSQSR